MGRLTDRRKGPPLPGGEPPRPLVLCVHGSPRVGGNTDLLLGALAEGARGAGAEVEQVVCRTLAAKPCTGCGGCSATGVCVLRDDLAAVYDLVDRATAVALGAPVYFLGLPAQVKAVIDRFQCRWARQHLLDLPPGPPRPGAFLSAAGSPAHSIFTCAQRTVEAWFEVLGVECRANLLYGGVDERGAVAAHPDALVEARRVGALLAADRGRR